MSETTHHQVTLDAVQMETVRRALDAAAELETQSLEGGCGDCDLDRDVRCDEHAASLTWRQEYRDLQRDLASGPELTAEALGAGRVPQGRSPAGTGHQLDEQLDLDEPGLEL